VNNQLVLDGKKVPYNTLTLISLFLLLITVFNGITDQLTLGLREFVDHSAISMSGKMRKFNGVLAKTQSSMMIAMTMRLMLKFLMIQI
jgi:hypothetical protein